ncbi:UNVERIFIED_CONTAM: hypothetical protein Sangu_2152300 [Sesamum angustifolium]|uniref:Uncharacterized protein n=1 Tax=Sesamum angustifolium TaxID=2727405 RepID=A0AAW2LG56_9LAMI
MEAHAPNPVHDSIASLTVALQESQFTVDACFASVMATIDEVRRQISLTFPQPLNSPTSLFPPLSPPIPSLAVSTPKPLQ